LVIAVLSCVLLTVIALVTYDVDLPVNYGLLVVAFIISVLSFTAVGILLGVLLPTTRSAQIVGLLLFFVMFILSGGGPPPEVITETMKWIGKVMPLSHTIILLQDVWNGLGWNWMEFVIVAGVMLLAAALTFFLFRWE